MKKIYSNEHIDKFFEILKSESQYYDINKAHQLIKRIKIQGIKTIKPKRFVFKPKFWFYTSFVAVVSVSSLLFIKSKQDIYNSENKSINKVFNNSDKLSQAEMLTSKNIQPKDHALSELINNNGKQNNYKTQVDSNLLLVLNEKNITEPKTFDDFSNNSKNQVKNSADSLIVVSDNMKVLLNNSFTLSYTHSPNLVSNGGFENEKTLFNTTSESWKACTKKDSPDFFDFGNNKTSKQFKQYIGGTEPRSGNGFIGIFAYRTDPIREYNNIRECVFTRLLEPLTKDSVYHFEMYVCLDQESNVALKNLSVAFSKKRLEFSNEKGLFKVIPQLSLFSGNYIDSKVWIKMSALYQAQGNECFMAIGNFKPDSAVKLKGRELVQGSNPSKKSKWLLEGNEKAAYYYIDDISLQQVVLVQDNDNTESQLIETTFSDVSKIKIDSSVVLKNVFFGFNKYNLLQASLPELQALLKLLKENKNMLIVIEGHTDDLGSKDYNEKLSLNRAKVVQEYLINNGINSNRLIPIGYGSTQPLELNNTEEGRSINRRVSVKIIKK